MVYDFVAALLRPLAWWGRLRVAGLDQVSPEGPLLVVPNHDSQWDPVLVGLAIKPRRRLRFLARASLWRIPGLGPLLYALNQIPIRRGAGDAGALEKAIDALKRGQSVCVFPEGGLSWGERLRARSGAGRLAKSCPEAEVVLCAVEGCTEYVRFPRRPRVRVTFFSADAGGSRPGEEASELATRLLDRGQSTRATYPGWPPGPRGGSPTSPKEED